MGSIESLGVSLMVGDVVMFGGHGTLRSGKATSGISSSGVSSHVVSVAS